MWKSVRTSNVLWLKYIFKGTNNWSYFLYCCRKLQGSANDGRWHHICVTWRRSDGRWQFYKDGELQTSNTGLSTGRFIQSGGSLVLGQDQDSVGGGFDPSQSFQGSLTNVNVWSRVLSASEINSLSTSCLSGEGDVYRWSDFIYGVKGNTGIVIPPSCFPRITQEWLLHGLRHMCSIFAKKKYMAGLSKTIVNEKRESQLWRFNVNYNLEVIAD